MEIVFEIIFEAYFELMMLIVPKEKTVSMKYKILFIILALIVFLGCLALFGLGILFVSDGNKMGWIPLSISIVISVVQIVVGFVLYCRRTKDQ